MTASPIAPPAHDEQTAGAFAWYRSLPKPDGRRAFAAAFGGFGSYLAELFPRVVRGTGQGFCYNTGRAVGAFFPTAAGFAAGSKGLGDALVYGVIGYLIAVLALLGLPETRGADLA